MVFICGINEHVVDALVILSTRVTRGVNAKNVKAFASSMSYAHPEILVDTDWVAKNCLEEGVRLVEVDYDPENAYHQGHIRGATLLRWTDLAKPGWLACRLFEYAWEPGLDRYADSTGHDGSGSKKFGKLASAHGIEEDTKVVLYGDTYNWFAAYALWIFKMRGHENVCLMNGGRRKWERDGREYVRSETKVRPAVYRAASAGQSFWTYLGDLHRALVDSKVRLVDVKSPVEYSDETAIYPKTGMGGTERMGRMPEAVNTLTNGICVRATYTERMGRMPEAVNVPWSKTINGGRHLQELRRAAGSLRVQRDSPRLQYSGMLQTGREGPARLDGSQVPAGVSGRGRL